MGGGEYPASSALSPAVAAPAASTPPGPQEEVFAVKRTRFLGTPVTYVCQNINGPCPLLAIANVLLLRGYIRVDWALQGDGRYVLARDLLQTVLRHLELANPPIPATQANELARLTQQKTLEDVKGLLPRLFRGLDVNVRFHSITAFEYTVECAVFDMLDIALVHGWLLDMQDERTANVVQDQSYNQLIERLVDYRGVLSTEERRLLEDGAATAVAEQTGVEEPMAAMAIAVAVTEDERSGQDHTAEQSASDTEEKAQVVQEDEGKSEGVTEGNETTQLPTTDCIGTSPMLVKKEESAGLSEASSQESKPSIELIEERSGYLDDSQQEGIESTEMPQHIDSTQSHNIAVEEQSGHLPQASASSPVPPSSQDEIQVKTAIDCPSNSEPVDDISSIPPLLSSVIVPTTHLHLDTNLVEASASALHSPNRGDLSPSKRTVQTLQRERQLSESDAENTAMKLLEEGPILEEFFASTASQLTYFGLSQLHEELRERQLCVFFRNNHFSTLFKLQGDLYLLVTDAGYLDEPSVVWERLNVIDGDTEYLDENFRSLDAMGTQQQQILTQQEQARRAQAVEASSSTPNEVSEHTENDDHSRSEREAHTSTEDPDFALAMRLQQEEEEAHARAQQAMIHAQESALFPSPQRTVSPPLASTPQQNVAGGNPTQSIEDDVEFNEFGEPILSAAELEEQRRAAIYYQQQQQQRFSDSAPAYQGPRSTPPSHRRQASNECQLM